MTGPEPFPPPVPAPSYLPPAGATWVPVTPDGLWFWDGQRWAPTGAAHSTRTGAGTLLLTAILIPLRLAWALVGRPLAGCALSLMIAFGLVLLVAHLVAGH